MVKFKKIERSHEMNAKKMFAVMAIAMLVFAFVGTQSFAAGEEKEKGAPTGKTYEREAYKGVQGQTGRGMTHRASEVMGLTVKDKNGEKLGEVEDIVINDRGQAQYIILSHGGVLGIGDKLIPIPYKASRLDVEKDALVLENVDKQMLERAPNFDKKDWKNIGEPEWDRKVYGYYGQEPTYGQDPTGYKTRGTPGTDPEKMRQEKVVPKEPMKEQREQKQQ
jgi:sporulation protein YlmC with PRC-barrel domain